MPADSLSGLREAWEAGNCECVCHEDGTHNDCIWCRCAEGNAFVAYALTALTQAEARIAAALELHANPHSCWVIDVDTMTERLEHFKVGAIPPQSCPTRRALEGT